MISKKGLHKKAWRIFSIWVRKKGSDWRGENRCYTCNRKFHWKELNAGHYRHDSYDFDEQNVKPQCVYCNLGENGRSDNFYLHLVKEYGRKVADKLRKRKKWNNYSISQLQEVIKKYADGT
jgi:hypothetical protein